ncbi:MAG TPA: T9SS type A sorting domain-containing protein, partial [Saprospiraceae bacterium]|nr:T9SS type A sorting domain-containing protein [Saprospiraceae bacterium]
VGNSSHPLFFDYNGDGLMDLLIGSNGDVLEGGNRSNSLVLFENTGTKTRPEFTFITDNYLNVKALNQIYTKLAPTLGDFDGDGDIDIIIGHSQGFMLYAENLAGKNNPPIFSALKNEWSDIFAGQNASPTVIDFDGDGLLDLVVGKLNNNLNFYKNRGKVNEPIFMGFNPDATNLGKLFIGNNFDKQHGSPEFFQIKDELYLLMGFSNGHVSLYHVPERNKDASFTLFKDNILPEHLGRQVNPAIIDIDSDGYFEIFIGNERGGINVYKSDIGTSDLLSSNEEESEEQGFLLYPNPAKNLLSLTGSSKGVFFIYDIDGRMLKKQIKAEYMIDIDVSELKNGMYILKMVDEQQIISKKFLISK